MSDETTELQSLSKLKIAGKLRYWCGTIEIPEIELHAICDEIQAEHDQAVAATLGSQIDADLRKAIDFMRIWIVEDAHLGESAISRELEKAEGLRKLDAIENAIAATLRSDDEYESKMDALLSRLTNGKWSKSRAYDLDFMVSCVDEEYEDAYEKERAELVSEINGDTSDGYHTFNELYHHRAILFSVIVRDHRELAWKARKHHDGTMYDGMFIVGIETPKGQATYHYDLDPYWEMFDCEEREYAPEWDGHTPDDAIARIAELGSGTCELREASWDDGTCTWGVICSACGEKHEHTHGLGWNFAPCCGRRVER